MSRWADTFAALSRDVDTSDTSRHIADLPPTVSRSVHSVTAPEPVLAPRRSATEAEQERAAIAERDGGIPRSWAEGVARLDPDHPPADVPLRRWQTFIDDIGGFLDSPFCAVAAALGWGPHDLFGADSDRPFARIDQAGLVWLLNAAKLVMLTEDAATIEMPTGTRHTWRRKPIEPGRVLAWQLTS